MLDRLEGQWRDLFAVPDDRLVLGIFGDAVGDLFRGDRPCLARQLVAVRRVRDDERADDLGREPPLGVVETDELTRQADLDLVDRAVLQFGSFGRIEDP